MLRAGPLALVVALLAGCGDEIVGYLEVSGSGGGEGTSEGDSTTSEIPLGLVPPGCISDDFEDGVLDPSGLWYTWLEQDAMLEEISGMLKLTPPSFGLYDTGVVGTDMGSFPFDNGRVRMRVAIPPPTDHPSIVFLQILDDLNSLVSIELAEQQVHIGSTQVGVQIPGEMFAMDPYPAFVAIRAEGGLVHFEISDDGTTYTTIATREKPASFARARALIMGQTYGDDPLRSLIAIDDFEVCVQ